MSNSFLGRWSKCARRGVSKRRSPLTVEQLEVRVVPTTVVVTTFSDEDDGFLGGLSGTSLREAIRYSAPGDTIQLSAGIYFLTRTGANEDAGSTGDLDVTKNLTIVGTGADQTTISGNFTDRAFDIHAAGPETPAVTIADLTITDGRTGVVGGGIRNAGSLTLIRAAVSNNAVVGADVSASGSAEDITGGSVEGGGIYNRGRLVVRDSTILDNLATGGSASVEYGTARGGTAVGGGIASGGSGADVELVNSTISGNVARGGRADGRLNPSLPIGGNARGGGLFVGAGGELSLVNSTVSENQAVGGAAFSNQFIATSGSAFGGGVFLDASVGEPQDISNSTITGNAAARGNGNFSLGTGTGGGIYLTGTATTLDLLESSIVALNSADAGRDLRAAGASFVSQGHNLIGKRDDLGSFALDAADLGFATPAALIDPLLGPLANNGGPTRTHALRAGSPAIDSGSNPLALTADQRGRPREFGPIDIGAFEFAGGTLLLSYGGAGTALHLRELSVAEDSVTVSEPSAGLLRIDLGPGTFAAGSSTAAGLTYEIAGSPTVSHFVTVDISAASAVSNLAIDLGAGRDTLAIGLSNTAGGVRDVTVTDSVGSDTLIDLNSLSLPGGILNVSGGPVLVTPGSTIATNGGALTLTGTGTAARVVGVRIDNATLDAGGGDIRLTGTGAAGTSRAYGIFVTGTGAIQTAGGGTITLHGTGGDGTSDNGGVRFQGVALLVAAHDGDLSITGVGRGSGDNNFGVELDGFARTTGAGHLSVTGTGTGSRTGNHGITVSAAVQALGSGHLTLNGASGGGTDFNFGVRITDGPVTTAGGDLSITGVGNGTDRANHGIFADAPFSPLLVQAGGSGKLTLHGTGGPGTSSNLGVLLQGAAVEVATHDGDLSITGVGRGASSGNSGIRIANAGTVVEDVSVRAGGRGKLTLHGTGSNGEGGNRGVDLSRVQVTSTDGDLTITGVGQGSQDGNTGVNLSGLARTTGTGRLAVTGTSLGRSGRNDGVEVQFGAVVETASGAITLTGTGSPNATSAGVRLRDTSRVTAGGGDPSKTLGLAPGSAIVVDLSADRAAASGYEFLHVAGTVDLGGASLQGTTTGAIPLGTTFNLLNNDGTADPVVGTFAPGGVVNVGGQFFAVHYAAFDGNDVSLTAVQPMTFVVDTATDENDGNFGPGDLSLREAVALSNSNPGSDTITFAAALNGQPLDLTLGQLLIADAVTITGNGAANTILDGQALSRIFEVTATGPTLLEGVTLRNGRATGADGGAVLNRGNLTLRDSVLANNRAGRDGGAINNQRSLTLVNSTVADNQAALNFSTASGGGLFNGSSATAIVVGSTFSGNEAGFGGAVRGGGTLSLTNSTLSGNRARLSGGGVVASDGTTRLTHVTITNNRADSDSNGSGTGGGVAVLSAVAILDRTIVADNFRFLGSDEDDDISGIVSATSAFNLLGTGGTGGLSEGGNGNQVGVADPRLGPLADNGGPTRTHALLADSPARNRAGNMAAPSTDQRGQPRPSGSAADVGAFEGQPSLRLTYGGAGTALTLSEVLAENNTVVVSEPVPGLLRIDVGSGGFAASSSVVAGLTYEVPGSPTRSSFATIDISAASAVSTFSIDLGAGSDTLALGLTNAAGGVRNVTVSDSIGSDTLIDLNSIALRGGNLDISGGSILVTPLSTITVQGGNLTLTGTGTAVRIVGIEVNTATLHTDGNLRLTGTGAAGTNSAFGIFLRDGVVQTSGSGTLTLHGTSGNGHENNVGVLLTNNATQVTTANGDLTITGIAQGTGAFNDGIRHQAGAVVQADGSGKLTLNGTGGIGTAINRGVRLGTGQLTTADGDLVITGVAQGTDDENDGISIATTVVQAGGSGRLTLHGTGGHGTRLNRGVFAGGARLTTANGNLSLTGVGRGTGNNNHGIQISFGAVQAGGNGTLTLHGTGGPGTNDNHGVTLTSDAQVTTVTGDLAITGVGQGTENNNQGVRITGGAGVHAGDSGKITLHGTGGNGTSTNFGVTIQTGQVTTTNGDLTITGIGRGTDSDNYGIDLRDIVRAGGRGTLTLHGTGGHGTDNNHGVRIEGSAPQVTTATGDLFITGIGHGTGISNDGIFIQSGVVQAGTGGTVTLNGTGGNGTIGNIGVRIEGLGTAVTTAHGALTITGTGRGSDANNGIQIRAGAMVHAGGDGALSLTGTSGDGTTGNSGVLISGADTQVATDNGAIVITGVGRGSAGSNHGVLVTAGAWVHADGNGSLTLAGTAAGTSDNFGVYVELNAQVRTAEGALTINGLSQGSEDNNYGIYIEGGAEVEAGGGGALSLAGTGGNGTFGNTGVRIDDAGTAVTTAHGALTITGTGRGSGAVNEGIRIRVGAVVHAGGDGALSLTGTGGNGTDGNRGVQISGTDTRLTTNAGTLVITGIGQGSGSDNDGIVNSAIVQAGGSGTVTLDGTGTVSSTGVRIEFGGRITAGGGDVTKNLGFAAGSAIFVGLSSSRAAASGYEFVSVDGTVDLGGGSLQATVTGAIPAGTTFRLLNNDGAADGNGTFATGGSITVGGQRFALDYSALDGNDISLMALPPAGVTITPTSGLVTTEAGGTATFNVVLDSRPTGDVTITFNSSDPTEGTVTPSITFTPANYSLAQVVTVTGVNDDLDDGHIGYNIVTAVQSLDALYAAINPADVSVTNRDDDLTVAIVGAPVNSSEGTAILLTSAVSDVGTATTFSLAWSVTRDGSPFATGTGATFTFTPPASGSYVVTLTATGDDGSRGTAQASITVPVTGGVARVVRAQVGTGATEDRQRSMVTAVAVTLDRAIAAADLAATLARFSISRSGGLTGTLSLTGSLDATRRVLTLRFVGTSVIGGSLADGRYLLTFDGATVLDGTRLFRLFGDLDGDADTDAIDAAVMSGIANGTRRGFSPLYNPFLDFNSNGIISIDDRDQFNRRLGSSLA